MPPVGDACSPQISTSATDRFYEFVVQTSWIDRLTIHLGFDPAKLSIDGVFHHLMEIAVANITFANMLALVGAIFYVATLMVRTIVPLRVIGIISIVFFIGYGAARRRGCDLLSVSALAADQRDPAAPDAHAGEEGAGLRAGRSVDGLAAPVHEPAQIQERRHPVPQRRCGQRDVPTVTGSFLVNEIGIELPPGRIMGELGFIDPKNRRTRTVECLEDGDVLTITYETLLEFYFQNPEFGYYLLSLTTERLMRIFHALKARLKTARPRSSN